jgi:hypothetical protein
MLRAQVIAPLGAIMSMPDPMAARAMDDTLEEHR